MWISSPLEWALFAVSLLAARPTGGELTLERRPTGPDGTTVLQLTGGNPGEWYAIRLGLAPSQPGQDLSGPSAWRPLGVLPAGRTDGSGTAFVTGVLPPPPLPGGLELRLQAFSMPGGGQAPPSAVRGSNVLAVAMRAQGQGSAPGAWADRSSSLGINLSTARYWNPQLAFVDVFRTSRPFQSNSGALSLRPDGYPASLGPGQTAWTMLCSSIEGHYPAGRYTCRYDGSGSIDARIDASVAERAPGVLLLDVAPTDKGILLEITATDPSDPVRNVRVLMPGFEDRDEHAAFHPDFLDLVDDFSVVRFMDWMNTNGSPVREWSDRSTPRSQTQGGPSGVSVEFLVQLANTLGVHPWFCIPHQASDAYVTAMATRVKELLDPSLQVYLEYSNEVWNSAFPQATYARQAGLALGLDPQPFAAQLKFYSQRSVEVFGIWESVFGDPSRLVRVLASQAANPWVSRTVLDWQGGYQSCDALAIAPYFGGRLGRSPLAEDVIDWSVDQVLDACAEEVQQLGRLVETHRKEATLRSLDLIAYEGGQHLVGVGRWQQHPALNTLFDRANRHPRMTVLYRSYLDAWKSAGGHLMALYADMSEWGSSGRWGLLEWYDQDPTTAPKWVGVQQFLQENPRWW